MPEKTTDDVIRKQFRFVIKKLPVGKSEVLHIESNLIGDPNTYTACAKTTDASWIRFEQGMLAGYVDRVTGRPIGTFQLCEQCLENDDVLDWLRATGWKARKKSQFNSRSMYCIEWTCRDAMVLSSSTPVIQMTNVEPDHAEQMDITDLPDNGVDE